jgi:hypothetical protein
MKNIRTLTESLPVIILLLVSTVVQAADTLKINLTYKHKLDDAGRTQGYITINQKFYTPDQVLFREINYDEQTSQISNYIFYFYTADKLSTEECYNQKDSLMYILKHEYNEDGKEADIVKFEPVNGSMEVTGRIVKSYDKSGIIVRQKEYIGKKTGISTAYFYDDRGMLIKQKKNFKSASRQTLKNETRMYSYNPDKSVAQVTVAGKDASIGLFQETEDYTYNDKGWLSVIRITGNYHPAGLVKTFKYLNTGALSQYQESDAAGKISLLLQYDYKKHFMDRGAQVSYFAHRK